MLLKEKKLERTYVNVKDAKTGRGKTLTVYGANVQEVFECIRDFLAEQKKQSPERRAS